MRTFMMKKAVPLALSAIMASALVFPSYGSMQANQNYGIEQTVPSKTALQQTIDKAANSHHIPGVIVAVKKGNTHWSYASGEATIEKKQSMQKDLAFRIGSTTKTFVATIVLQLVGEKKLRLDDTVEKWLPGLLHSNGYDGSKVTIRQLLNHTSGIANYLNDEFKQSILQHPNQSYTPDELIAKGLQSSPMPGGGYSNTNYVILGLIIQKATGKTYAEQIKQRILKPLHMNRTWLPGTSTAFPTKHARGYLDTGDALVDITGINPSLGGAAGEIISTGDDMTTFFSALLGGKLLQPALLKEMMTTVDIPEGKFGLGLQKVILPNGVTLWGHSGGIPGFMNFAGGTEGGEHVIEININVMGNAPIHIESIYTQEFSGSPEQSNNESKHRNEIIALIDQATTRKSNPGIVAYGIMNGEGWAHASGIADMRTGRPMETNLSFRIGSVTKAFIATVVLQLAQEHKLSLDDSVEKWLPGVVQGNGYDGNKIKIRHLLQQTSGIASYTSNEFRDLTIPQAPFRNYIVDELIQMGLATPPKFEPGTSFDYSNTNTVLAGLIIKKVTGDTYAEQIKKRIIEPLGLIGTSSSGSSLDIPGEHAVGYNLDVKSGDLYDFTVLNPSWANAAGDMVSTAKDLATFFSALLGGKLLHKEMLKEMTTGVPSPFGSYGLGSYEVKMPNGTSYWAHGGGIHGYSTLAAARLGGEQAFALSTNAVGNDVSQTQIDIFKKEFSY